MTPPARRPRPHPIAARALALAALAAACASAPQAPPAPPEDAAPAGDVRVLLVFDEAADLDLYVTDPLKETVYFANARSASGGSLAMDLRCDAPAPRVESVRFRTAPAGRYRVGVDFPERCRSGAGLAAFRIVVEAGGRRRETSGEIAFGEYRPLVLEFDAPEAEGANSP